MTCLVRLQEVSRSFGAVRVLSDVSLEVAKGEVVALYGRSGSGKTTLLNIVGGLDQPTAGRAEVLGRELGALTEPQLDELRRTQIGFVFQSYGLLPHLPARENVEFALRLAGVERRLWRDRVEEALEWVGLTRRALHRPPELSGGERQRVALARALAIRPRLLLADEPTGALDHATGLAVTGLLVRVAAQTGAGVLLVTHDTSIRERVDRAFAIKEGRLAPAAEVIR